MAFTPSKNRAETHRLRIETIDANLNVEETFVQMAEEAIAYPIRAEMLISKARIAYETTGRFLTEVEHGEARNRLATRREAIHRSIRRVERKLPRILPGIA